MNKRILALLLSVVFIWTPVPTSAQTPNQTFEVNSTADTDDGICDGINCTLREAINAANASPGLDEIVFDIPPSDPGHMFYANDSLAGFVSGFGMGTTVTDDAQLPNPDPDYPYSWFRIAPTSPLPTIIDPVIVDGYSQGSSTPSTQGDDARPNSGTIDQGLNTIIRIELFGQNAGFVATGLTLGEGSGGSTIRGLAIKEFRGTDQTPGHGIFVSSDGNRVEGNFLGPGVDGLTRSLNTHGIQITGASNTIGGLTPGARNLISGNNRAGLFINGGAGGNTIQGNIIGLKRTGVSGQGNFRDGVPIVNSPNNIIGGNSPNSRNVISNNGSSGIAVVFALATGNIIQGNYVGTDVTGTVDIGNTFHGILFFQAPGNAAGGSELGAGNLCSGNGQGGVTFDQSNDTRVQGNLLGTDITGTMALGNDFSGVLAVNSSNCQIGGSQAASNTIAFNKTGGVVLAQNSLNNPVRLNSIFSNLALGIDLSPTLNNGTGNGTDENDGGDADGGPNKLQNFPEIQSAGLTGMLNVTYSVSSTAPNSIFPLTVDLYLADIPGEEGRIYLGSDTYNQGDGQKNASITPAVPVSPGVRIVATATDAHGNTSEFSPSVLVGGEAVTTTLRVNSTGDAQDNNLLDGICDTGNEVNGQPECTLCAALAQAGATPDVGPANPVQVHFAIPPTDAGHVYYSNDGISGQITPASVAATASSNDASIAGIDPDWPHSWYTIRPNSTLPVVTQPVVINGYTQAGALANTNPTGSGLNTVLRIELNGEAVRENEEGLLRISAGSSAVKGLTMNRTDGPKIQLETLGDNRIEGCFLGSDISGTGAYPLPGGGIRVIERPAIRILSPHNAVGEYTPESRNLISANNYLTGLGVQIGSISSPGGASNTLVIGNLIGVDRTGTHSLSNSISGVSIIRGGHNTIGGTSGGSANVIAEGITISRFDASSNSITGNIIGADITGTQALLGGPPASVGVTIESSSNTISLNTIAFLGGVTISSGSGNLISQNSIFSTAFQGIDLRAPNELNSLNLPQDDDDTDTGSNDLQNSPYITTVTATPGGTTVEGLLNSAPNSNYRLEFFASRERDPSAFGEGEMFLGSLNITTDAAGHDTFTANLPPMLVGFTFISATATDITIRPPSTEPANNTSEFSGALPIGGCGLTVTTTADTGVGSLREAILCANILPGIDTIDFAISGNGPHVIQPNDSLPDVVDPVIIDGYTQGDQTPGDPSDDALPNANPAGQDLNTVIKVQIDGVNAPALTDGLTILAGSSIVRGLSFTGFDSGGILLRRYGGNQIQGNFMGVTPDGIGHGNGTGISIAISPDNLIGGADPADWNLISSNSFGIDIDGARSGILAPNNVIQGNIIGARNNVPGLGNEFGVYVGTNKTRIEANTVAFNSATGITVGAELAPNSRREAAILRNSIYQNGGIGIDLDDDGVTSNDPGTPPDQDEGANSLQNFPELTSRIDSPVTEVEGMLQSTPNAGFRIEFFANSATDPTGHGEGEEYLGSVDVTTDANGNAQIAFNAQVSIPDSHSISATATRKDEGGTPIETSEFSARIGGVGCSTVVTQTGDSGPGSLREAIICANLTPGLNTISFSIPGMGPHVIRPKSSLPEISDPVVIDGYTQGTETPDPSDDASPNSDPNGFNGRLLIELNGEEAGIGADGLDIAAGGCTVRGLAINGFRGIVQDDLVFGGSGIALFGKGGNVITGNFLGTDVNGTTANANSFGVSAVSIDDGITSRIGGALPSARNIISGNEFSGVLIQENEGTRTVLRGNFIGTDVTGTEDLGNGENGVLISASANNVIGGESTSDANVISGNEFSGVALAESGSDLNIVQGNIVGTDLSRGSDLGNSLGGIDIDDGEDNSTLGNWIAYNGAGGVNIFDGSRNSVLGNSITQNEGLGIDLVGDGVTPNDISPISVPPDTDEGPNNLQNFPVLDFVGAKGTGTTFHGTLSSTPNTSFRIDFFASSGCDSSGNGEGARFLGFTETTTSAQGEAIFEETLPLAVFSGEFVTATATRLENGMTPGDTSEFSACFPVTIDTGPTPTPTEKPPCPDPYPDFVVDQEIDAKDLMALITGIHQGNGLRDLTGDSMTNADDLMEFTLSWHGNECSGRR